jgi:hypothetical protein
MSIKKNIRCQELCSLIIELLKNYFYNLLTRFIELFHALSLSLKVSIENHSPSIYFSLLFLNLFSVVAI